MLSLNLQLSGEHLLAQGVLRHLTNREVALIEDYCKDITLDIEFSTDSTGLPCDVYAVTVNGDTVIQLEDDDYSY